MSDHRGTAGNESAALLVIDVQAAYMVPAPFVTCDGDDLIAKCRGLIDRARAEGVPVVYVKHLDETPPADPTAAEICREIAPRATESVVEKRFPSAFFRTNLGETLEDLGVRRCTRAAWRHSGVSTRR